MADFTFPKHDLDLSDYLRIVKDSKVYCLPERWALTNSGSYTFDAKIENRAFAHGGYVIGDKKLEGRNITVEFSMLGATKDEHDEAVNLAYSWFTLTDYKLFCGNDSKYYKVAACSKITASFQKGFKQRFSTVKVTLLLADPFRYASTSKNIVTEYTEKQTAAEIILINNSPVDVPLIWTFTPAEGKTAADITIKHVESGESFSLTDSLLTAPAVAVVNAEEGTVRRDEGNSLNTFKGVFLHALTGTNTYKYTGDACNVTITYTDRWYV
jgi:hypothetical protein